MAERGDLPGPGGFFRPGLMSPAPSTASTRSLAGLPHPRSQALRAGSAKEDKIRRYIEERLLHISRRYVKKHGLPEPDDEVIGYQSMSELCKDLDALVDVIWLSGTPSLQIPYLLNTAGEFISWVAAFPPSPRRTFAVLRKLDHCFASLLSGEDIETNEPLPGFENGPRGGMSRTDMVRCKSIVEQTRVVIVDVMSKEPEVTDEERVTEIGDETDSGADATDEEKGWDEETDDPWHMDVARVYEHALVELGKSLGEGAALGDIQMTDD